MKQNTKFLRRFSHFPGFLLTKNFRAKNLNISSFFTKSKSGFITRSTWFNFFSNFSTTHFFRLCLRDRILLSNKLLLFNCFKQSFKITRPKTVVVMTFNHFNKQSGSVLQRFGKNLQQIAIIIIIH